MEKFLLDNIVALSALAVSLFTLYLSVLRPFSLKVHNAGRINLTKDPHSIGFTHALFFLDIIFSNKGARRGVVEDVALMIKGSGKKQIFPAKFYNIDRQMNLTEGLHPPKLETFIGFNIDAGESVVHQIGFAQKQGDEPFPYHVGRYDVEIFVFTSKKEKWVKADSFSFIVEKDDIDQLSKMSATPHPQGGSFITMVVRDKKTYESEDRINQLKN